MQVYLDEPTQEVIDGMTITRYAGHFYEEEFMITPSEGQENTGFPLMYPYDATGYSDVTTVIDTQNHSITLSDSRGLDPVNIASRQIRFGMQDFPWDVEPLPTSGNKVFYSFTRYVTESDDVEPEQPIVIPANPSEGEGSELGPIHEN